jgi:rRNA maturation RNase YbeY
MINIKNTQRKIKMDTDKIEKIVQCVINLLGYNDFDIGVWLTTSATIRSYNKQYRQLDKPTDILSFPYHNTIRGGDMIKVVDDDDKNLGDLILSPEYITQDAPGYDQTFEQRVEILLVHGICHLLGYDHITDDDYETMHRKETFLLKALHDQK